MKKNGNSKIDSDIIIYEPIRRNDDAKEGEQFKNEIKSKNYSGLYNRGNTCYLNSLLQSLFMTPEFRSSILNWKYEAAFHGDIADCIPFQVQKLFARLQLKCRESETTEDLTKSFQWDHSQLMEQHDIQELCRVLFEAIENSLSETEENFVYKLFEGGLESVVKCNSCSTMSIKSDRFLDISLPIRNEFEKIYNSSLEMAFSNFLKKEHLNKDNQYFCNKCNKKVDAEKYLQFTKLPNILFLQLNRFEYDYSVDARRKICDRITFPETLDMSPFLQDYDKIKEIFTKEKINELEQRSKYKIYYQNLANLKENNDSQYLYRLYAVVIHSGCARGGHYYSYIKSFEDDSWYKFDDNRVYQSDFKDIESTYGDNNNACYAGATAYILMYKLINKEDNLKTDIINRKIPTSLMELIDKENIQLAEEDAKLQDRLNTLQLNFFYNNRVINIFEKRNSTIKQLKRNVMKEYGIIDKFEEKNVRVRNIHNQSYKLQEPFVFENKTLEEYGINPNKRYTLETKTDNEEFEAYDPNIISVNICIWKDKYTDWDEKDFPWDKIKINNQENVSSLIDKIKTLYNINKDQAIYVFKKLDSGINNYSTFDIGKDEAEMPNPISKNMIVENCKLFVEIKDNNWTQSRFIENFDAKTSNIIVNFNTPLDKTKIKRIIGKSYTYTNQFEIRKSKSLHDVKLRISEILNIPENAFIIKKNGHNGAELKNLNETIDKHTLNMINIYVESGTPKRDSEIKINLMFCDYDYTFFSVYPYKISDFGFIVVDLNWKVAELKQLLIGELRTKKNIELLNEKTIIRDYNSEKPGKIYNGESILKDLDFKENKKIIVQNYKFTIEDFNNNDIQIAIREWEPDNWKISDPLELQFHKNTTLLEFSNKLIQHYPNIKPEYLSAFKVVNFNMYMDDFKKQKFENLYDKSDFTLNNFPFYIGQEGSLLIIKDDSRIYREPNEEETKIYCKPKLSAKKPLNGRTSLTSNISSTSVNSNLSNKITASKVKNKEKGVIIKVKRNESRAEKINQNSFASTDSKTQEYNSTEKSNELLTELEINSSLFKFASKTSIDSKPVETKPEQTDEDMYYESSNLKPIL